MWRKEHAVAIINIISKCFGDIHQVEEPDIEPMEGMEIDVDWVELLDDSTLMDMAPSHDEDSFSTDFDATLITATRLNSNSILAQIVNYLSLTQCNNFHNLNYNCRFC